MTSAPTQKTPAAVLADERGEGLNSPLTKKESTTMVSAPQHAGHSPAALSTRVDLGGDCADILSVSPDQIDLTFSFRGDYLFGMRLTATEARKIASALLDAAAPDFGTSLLEEIEEHVEVARKVPVEIPVSELAAGTITDIVRFANDHCMSSGDVMRAVESYIDAMAETESLTPAQWCKRHRQHRRATHRWPAGAAPGLVSPQVPRTEARCRPR